MYSAPVDNKTRLCGGLCRGQQPLKVEQDCLEN